MKVIIGDRLFDADRQPICIVLTPREKKLIADMSEETTRLVVAPPETSEETMQKLLEAY